MLTLWAPAPSAEHQCRDARVIIGTSCLRIRPSIACAACAGSTAAAATQLVEMECYVWSVGALSERRRLCRTEASCGCYARCDTRETKRHLPSRAPQSLMSRSGLCVVYAAFSSAALDLRCMSMTPVTRR